MAKAKKKVARKVAKKTARKKARRVDPWRTRNTGPMLSPSFGDKAPEESDDE